MVKFTIVLALLEVFAEEKSLKDWKLSLFRALLMEKLAEIYDPRIKSKAYLTGLFSTSYEILGQSPEDVAKEISLDKEIVEAYEGKPNALRFLLSLTYLLEDRQNDEMYEKVAKRVNSSPEHIKKIVSEALKEADTLLSYAL